MRAQATLSQNDRKTAVSKAVYGGEGLIGLGSSNAKDDSGGCSCGSAVGASCSSRKCRANSGMARIESPLGAVAQRRSCAGGATGPIEKFSPPSMATSVLPLPGREEEFWNDYWCCLYNACCCCPIRLRFEATTKLVPAQDYARTRDKDKAEKKPWKNDFHIGGQVGWRIRLWYELQMTGKGDEKFNCTLDWYELSNFKSSKETDVPEGSTPEEIENEFQEGPLWIEGRWKNIFKAKDLDGEPVAPNAPEIQKLFECAASDNVFGTIAKSIDIDQPSNTPAPEFAGLKVLVLMAVASSTCAHRCECTRVIAVVRLMTEIMKDGAYVMHDPKYAVFRCKGPKDSQGQPLFPVLHGEGLSKGDWSLEKVQAWAKRTFYDPVVK